MKQSLQSYLYHIFLDSWHPFAWFVLIGFSIYAQSLFFGFSYLDDNVLIVDHIHFLKNLVNFPKLFGQDIFFGQHPYPYTMYYRPVLASIFMLETSVFGANPLVYHLTNILIHIATTCFLFSLLLRLNFSKVKVFILSILFVAHPVLCHAVYWIPGRNDSLLTLLIIISFVYFLRFIETEKKKDYFIQIVFFVLALLVKESALAFPIICAAYILLIKGKATKSVIRKQALGWAIVVILWFFVRKLVIGNIASFLPAALINTALISIPMMLLYFGKIFLPFNLSIMPILPDSNLLYGFFCLIVFIVFLFFCSKENWKYVLFGFIWFFVFLIMSFLRPHWSITHDFQEHRIYLPMIGFVIALAALRPFKQWKYRNIAGVLLSCVFLILFVIVHFNISQKYKNRLNFWISAAESSPHLPFAHRNLGAMYYLEGEWGLAEKEYKKALSLNPYEEMVHNNLGLIYMNRGKPHEAEQEFLQELSIRPNSSLAFYNLGILYYRQGFRKEAEVSFLESIKYNPNYNDAYRALSINAYHEGNLEKAEEYLKELQKRGEDIDFMFFEASRF